MPTKSWYLSKTIRGSILVLVQLILNQAGVDVTGEELAPLSDSIIAILGVILAVVGRSKASTRLTIK